jgi:RNA polymerase sigma factor (sigma-70 family)
MCTEREIMEGCFRGDSFFINAFYKKYKNLIYCAIHRWMRKNGERSPDEVQDLFNSIFIKLMDNNFALLRGVHNINRPSPLIFIIAYQYTGRFFATRRAHLARTVPFNPMRDEPADLLSLDPGEIELLGERPRILEEAIATLNERQQYILRLRYGRGLRYQEIAEETGLYVNNVGAIIRAAKLRIREFIVNTYPGIL